MTAAAGAAVTVSAIVPAWNAAATIACCLAPLVAMQRRGEIVEIIVADDGATDATARIAAESGARVIPSGGRLGPGGARNVAAAQATGDVLWFVDADVIVHDDAARVVAATLQPEDFAAVFGAYDDTPAATNFLSQYKNLVHHHYHRDGGGEAETFWAGCGAVRRAEFLAAGGFDAQRYPYPSIEDIELGMRLRASGLRIRLVPELAGTHLKEWRLANLLHTDIARRAIPWARLIRARGSGGDTLNLRAGERWRAVLAWGFFASVALALARVAPWWLPVVLFVAAVAANARLAALFRRRRGALFALGGLLFHQFYYVYASAAYAWVSLDRRAAAVADAGSASSSAR